MTIRHVVSWTFDGDAAQRHATAVEAKRRLDTLPGVVPSIRSFSVSVNSVPIDGNSDAVLIAEYDDVDALHAYIANADHQEVVAYIRPRSVTRTAVDFEV